jgi:L-fuculose-phosphate aldolase
MVQNLHKMKQEMCEIGRRMYAKGYCAANDGNISYRLSEKEVLCTPTMVSKGFLKPEDLCTVDLEGNQLSGRRKRTSEIFLHLAIMKARPDVRAVVHCHPPHATAFGIAREPVPLCVMPEAEIFLGEVPIAKYALPGTKEFAETVLPFVHKANIVILANHGTVSYSDTLEKAYWWTEVLDSYCRILMLARSLGNIHYFSESEAQALLQLKEKLGFQDPRAELKNCDICANDVFRESWKEVGVEQRAFQPPRRGCSWTPGCNPTGPSSAANPSSQANGQQDSAPLGPASPEQEALIQTITDRVMAILSQG